MYFIKFGYETDMMPVSLFTDAVFEVNCNQTRDIQDLFINKQPKGILW